MLGWIRQRWNLQRTARCFLHKRTWRETQVERASWFWHHAAKNVWSLSEQVSWFLEYYGRCKWAHAEKCFGIWEWRCSRSITAMLELSFTRNSSSFSCSDVSFPFSLPCDLLVYIILWNKTSPDPPTPSALQLPFPGYLANPAELHALLSFHSPDPNSNPLSLPWTRAIRFPFSQPWCSSHLASCSVNLPKLWKQSKQA